MIVYMIIGYSGYSVNKTGIADRRRLLHWANFRGYEVVSAKDNRADFVVLTSSSNLGEWRNTKRTKPVVLDVVDGLIGESSLLKDTARGLGYWMTMKSTSRFPSRFSRALVSMAKASDIVICSSPEQVHLWSSFGVKARDILDFHDEIPRIDFKEKVQNRGTTSFFWEGLPVTLKYLDSIGEILEKNLKQNFIINILSKLRDYRYMNRYGLIDVDNLIKSQMKWSNLGYHLIDWSPGNCEYHAKNSTMGIIPISKIQGYNHLKAENRLLIMWRLGLITLTGDLPSYQRVFKSAGIQGACDNKKDWAFRFSELQKSKDLRQDYQNRASLYLEENHSHKKLIDKWDQVLSDLLHL